MDTRSITSPDDLTLEANTNPGSPPGRFAIKLGSTEYAAIEHDGTNSGLFAKVQSQILLLKAAVRAQAANITGSAVYAISTQAVLAQTNTGLAPWLFYLDPADYAAHGSTTKLRVFCGCLVTDTAPGVNFTIGLYPVAAMTGGTNVTNPNFGTVVTGSTVAFTTPAANSITAPASSGDFTFPAAGYYGIGFNISGAMAANSSVVFTFRLEAHYV